MKLFYLAFTGRGMALAESLAAALGGEAMRCGRPMKLDEWTAAAFPTADGLVFVGAAGIAVRAIAPHVRSKTSDPAVVVVDECGRFAIPLLSGHLGGANDLARKIAGVCGAVPVITTATDANGVFAVDEWAKRQGCVVVNAERIKLVSGALLAGKPVRVRSPWPIAGESPAGVIPVENGPCDVLLDVCGGAEDALRLVPKIAVLGVGCRRGISCEALEAALETLLQKTGLAASAICAAATIDLKKDEAGLLKFCERHGWPLRIYSAEQLRQAEGEFTASAFVTSVTGVDNVCERAAVLAAGEGGTLRWKKLAGGGVTMAAALRPFAPNWRWQDE